MILLERDTSPILRNLEEKSNEGYTHVEDGSVAQMKALTLCLRQEWYRVHGEGDSIPREALTDSSLKWLVGTAFGRLLNTDEKRITLDLPSGKISGRLDDRHWNTTHTTYYPVEYKVTWGGKRGNPSSQYLEQLKTYMTALDTDLGELDIFHMVGGGASKKAFSPSPYVETFVMEMERWERREWFGILEARLQHVVGDEAPDFPDMHYPWECGYCKYKAAGICHAPKGTKS